MAPAGGVNIDGAAGELYILGPEAGDECRLWLDWEDGEEEEEISGRSPLFVMALWALFMEKLENEDIGVD